MLPFLKFMATAICTVVVEILIKKPFLKCDITSFSAWLGCLNFMSTLGIGFTWDQVLSDSDPNELAKDSSHLSWNDLGGLQSKQICPLLIWIICWQPNDVDAKFSFATQVWQKFLCQLSRQPIRLITVQSQMTFCRLVL